MLTVLVGVDLACSLFYILDYNNYIEGWVRARRFTRSDFYYWLSLIMVADFFLRLLLLRRRYLCLRDVRAPRRLFRRASRSSRWCPPRSSASSSTRTPPCRPLCARWSRHCCCCECCGPTSWRRARELTRSSS